MEFFQKASVVRLRSHHEKYMAADDDEETVYQERNGNYENSKWTVEIVDNSNVIRLKSCYGKYLTASNMPFLLKSTARKVFQTLPRRLDSSVEWEPVREGFQVRLRTRYGQYLRGNGGFPPWRNSVTHDVLHRSATANWVLWDVDIVEVRAQAEASKSKSWPKPIRPPDREMNPIIPTDRCPSPSVSTSPPLSPESESSNRIDLKSPVIDELGESTDISSPVKEGRTIFYDVGDENGEVSDPTKEAFFTFKGNSVQELKEKLKEETGLDEILVCCRNPLTAKLYPLRLHLPPNKSDMHVVVVPSSAQD